MKDKDLEQVFALFKQNDDVLLTTLDYPRVAEQNDFQLMCKEDIIMNGTIKEGLPR